MDARMDRWRVGLLLASSERGRWDVQEGGKESRRRGDSQGMDDIERVAGCGFRGSDAGWLVDGKADEQLLCRGWLMIAADDLKVRSMTVALTSIWEIGHQDLFPTRKNGRRS